MEFMNELQKELVKGLCEYLDLSTYSEIKEVINKVMEINENKDDFTIDGLWFSCGSREIRIISESAIDDIWSKSLEEQIKECYDLGDSKLPSFIEIDWEKTIDNCKQDGEGHHFSSWDGSEHQTENFYYFKN